MLVDDGRPAKFKMAVIKPEVEITFDRWRRDSNVYPHIFGHARLGCATADTARRRLTLPNVDRLQKIEMAATDTGHGNNN